MVKKKIVALDRRGLFCLFHLPSVPLESRPCKTSTADRDVIVRHPVSHREHR